MELAVVIVTWNVRELALDALHTLQADVTAHGPDTQIWVVDNASVDHMAEAVRENYPDVNLIASPDNLGFGAGNNLALTEMGFGQDVPIDDLPRAVFLLNPDTLVHTRAVLTLYEALFAAPDVGMVGARLTYEDGSFQHSAFGFPGVWQTAIDLLPVPSRLPGRLAGRLYGSGLNGRYASALYEGSRPFPVDHVLGATMMLRREVIQQTGMFDEQFFMYCEEVDWAMRIRQAGWQILCVPQAHITHLEGKSTAQIRSESTLNLWRSRFQLYEKHYAPLKLATIRQVVRLGMRRKIIQARQDSALSADQQAALIEAYQAVAQL
ncbi:glycosyltransferase family 2 protein [Chloroflexota bacterium]